jgi:hypothetical protein
MERIRLERDYGMTTRCLTVIFVAFTCAAHGATPRCAHPAYVKLDHAKMEEVDGRKEKTLRFRPWPDERGRIDHQDVVIEDMRIHHYTNDKAIMVSSGSPDKPRVQGKIASFTSITFRNLDIGHIYRTQPGLHMDHIWIGKGHDASFRPNVTFEDIYLHDGNEGVMPILFEAGGNWGTLTFRRVALADVAHPIMIKLGGSSFKEIIVEESPGVRIALQGDGEPVAVRVRRSAGAQVYCPRDESGRVARQVTIVQE